MRLPSSSGEPIWFSWNGTSLEGRQGDTVAAALHAAGQRYLVPSRKFHEPRGLSGSFVAGHLATVDGVPNCRLDHVMLSRGMDVSMQGAWPSTGMDLLRLGRLVPRDWLCAGFEHPRLVPDQSILWKPWERALAFAAGGGRPPPSSTPQVPVGQRLHAGTVVVGGGSAGLSAAQAAAETGNAPVIVVSDATSETTAPEGVSVYAGHRVFALYDSGNLVAAAPLDGAEPAFLIDADRVVLATGTRSTPPLVPGAALPGVLDATLALRLARKHGVAVGERVVVVGTSRGRPVADELQNAGVAVIGFYDVDAVTAIHGRNSVKGAGIGGQTVACDAVVHAGPWRPDPSLKMHASWGGELRLVAGDLPDNVSSVGSGAEAPEPVSFGASDVPDPVAFVCPCMDVTVGEVLMHVERGVTHVEELKRLTGCGMGPCQGIPCWDLLAVVVGHATGRSPEEVGHPTYRPPRAALTFGQAAGLTGITEVAQ